MMPRSRSGGTRRYLMFDDAVAVAVKVVREHTECAVHPPRGVEWCELCLKEMVQVERVRCKEVCTKNAVQAEQERCKLERLKDADYCLLLGGTHFVRPTAAIRKPLTRYTDPADISKLCKWPTIDDDRAATRGVMTAHEEFVAAMQVVRGNIHSKAACPYVHDVDGCAGLTWLCKLAVAFAKQEHESLHTGPCGRACRTTLLRECGLEADNG